MELVLGCMDALGRRVNAAWLALKVKLAQEPKWSTPNFVYLYVHIYINSVPFFGDVAWLVKYFQHSLSKYVKELEPFFEEWKKCCESVAQ